MGKHVVCAVDSPELRERLNAILARLGVSGSFSASAAMVPSLAQAHQCDLVVYEPAADIFPDPAELGRVLAAHDVCYLLLVLAHGHLAHFRLPSEVPSDFMMADASAGELAARVSLALRPASDASPELLTVGEMQVNLATYQVTVSGEPLDLTYLEYALLAFLVTHSGHAYSRDALLHHVWGFDYYGGSRTVDVHVRRVRAKLGPELAQRLETVRGVGYLWSD